MPNLIDEVKAKVPRIDATEGRALFDKGVTFLDVREPNETSQGAIPGAVINPRGTLETSIENKLKDKSEKIVVYCAGGTRSAFAVDTLQQMGYEDVVSMDGGFNGWKNGGHPWEIDDSADKLNSARYSRHLLIPEVGAEGQKKLFNARVLLLGAGGLGSPAAMYLAAAGVGTIGLVDADTLDESNLQRQIIHRTVDVGRPKVDSAEEFIRNLNPDVKVVKYRKRLDSSNAMELLKDWDIVLNGCDNFPTRYLLNDACFFLGIPIVDGGIFRFEGQVTVYDPKGQDEAPCYRCLYPEPPPPELAPSCAEAGVLGVLPGIVGTLQAAEAIKLIVGAGESLQNRLVLFDALTMKFRELKLRKDPHCSLCGPEPTVTELIDYEFFCAAPIGN
jgi:molybdopterin/thiamine biosynthesis adenylyltransferase/rhodanese-related sulfurtransferase